MQRYQSVFDQVRDTTGLDVSDSQINVEHLKFRAIGEPEWNQSDIKLLEGPVMAEVHEHDWRKDAKVGAKVTPGRMIVRVNIENDRFLGVNKTMTLQPPPSRTDLPAVNINPGKISQVLNAGAYTPNLSYSRSGKTVRYRPVQYAGEFRQRVRVTGRIPYKNGRNFDQLDASHLDGNDYVITGNCQYEIVY